MTQGKPKVLIASYLESELVEQIRQEILEVEVIYRPDLLGKPRYIADHNADPKRTPEQETEWLSLLAEADILFDFDYTHLDDLPERAPKVRWIQATSAGIGQFVKRMRYTEQTNWIFTTASGVHSRPLAEFVIMAMLFFAKDFEYLQREKAGHHWERYCATELAGKTMAIIGLGNVGREVARLAKSFDLRVVGSRRTRASSSIPNVDQLYSPDELGSLLVQANYLVLSCPHTPDTDSLIGMEELARLPKGAIVINIARGAVMNQPALTEALRSGHLRGAALDVFASEPLPTDDPLWDMPNVIISPHSASTADNENAKISRLFCDNLKRFLSGEPMLNVLDVERYY